MRNSRPHNLFEVESSDFSPSLDVLFPSGVLETLGCHSNLSTLLPLTVTLFEVEKNFSIFVIVVHTRNFHRDVAICISTEECLSVKGIIQDDIKLTSR